MDHSICSVLKRYVCNNQVVFSTKSTIGFQLRIFSTAVENVTRRLTAFEIFCWTGFTHIDFFFDFFYSFRCIFACSITSGIEYVLNTVFWSITFHTKFFNKTYDEMNNGVSENEKLYFKIYKWLFWKGCS